ncbi:MAG: biosynthetic-type acetolactate synthase large subunit [candidate division KSB1 bacterium]|nr:biosynthetic-type acetolactate synthase large subunit [candidate division KSB1 bacterium]
MGAGIEARVGPSEIRLRNQSLEAQAVEPAYDLSGAEILVRALAEQGVKTLFGIPGGAVLGLADAVGRYGRFRWILTKHEQGATHAADGYARYSGRVGVVLVTSGPGSTNTVTGIATAYMDSSPIVVLTGQVPLPMVGNDAFQEVDTIGVTRPITKHSFLLRSPNDIADTVRKAFYIAGSGRPGPVVIDMPKDVLAAHGDYIPSAEIVVRGYKPKIFGHAHQISRAAERINRARRPVLYIGGGVVASGASDLVRRLAIENRIPVTSTLMGLGAFPSDHPLWLGMLGMHGTWTANMAVQTADLIIAIGARFDDRVTGRVADFAPQADIIHIDIDSSVIGRNVQVDIPIVGDARHVLIDLVPLVKGPDTKEWLEQIERWRQDHPLRYDRESQAVKPQYVIEKLAEVTDGEAVIVTDVGQHQMWTAQFYRFKHPRTIITSGGLGTMGFGLPAAMGVAIAQEDGAPRRPVVAIVGDGGFQMTMEELITAVAYRVPVKVFVINNGYLGMVRQWQELFFGRRYVASDLRQANPDLARVAESMGAMGLRVERREEVQPAIEKALSCDSGPVVIDFRVDGQENVFPMVPAGAALHEMIEARPSDK